MAELRAERTGTIVMGQHVRISPIAVSHGNLRVEIKAPSAPQPPGQQPGPGQEVPLFTVPEGAGILLFKGEVDLKEVVDGLNKIGASSAELVQVLKSIKKAGTLHADLEIR